MNIQEMHYDPKGPETGILYKMQLDLMEGMDDAAALQWVEEGNSEALRLLCESDPSVVELYQKNPEQGLLIIRGLLEAKLKEKGDTH